MNVQPPVVALFGAAKLVRVRGSKYELRDASEDEMTAAKEWVSLFMHEAVFSAGPAAQRRETRSSRWKMSSFGNSAYRR